LVTWTIRRAVCVLVHYVHMVSEPHRERDVAAAAAGWVMSSRRGRVQHGAQMERYKLNLKANVETSFSLHRFKG
jgi:hypothetical protein